MSETASKASSYGAAQQDLEVHEGALRAKGGGSPSARRGSTTGSSPA